MTKCLTKSALSLAATLALLHPAAAARVTYLSLLGDDANDCSFPTGSPVGPCLGLSRALAQTDPGGEIIVLGPGFWNFGFTVTITKSVRITADADQALLTAGSGSNGQNPVITINAGAGDVVSLRGLTFDGEGTETTGIRIQQASAVHIQNCVIRNFEAAPNSFGIAFVPTRNSQMFVSDTIIYNNGSASLTGGILVEPQNASSSANVVLDRVHLENNVDGLLIDGAATSGPGSHVVVRDSVMSGNAGNGIHALTTAGMSPAFALVEHSSMVNNGQNGIRANGPGATVLLKESTITRNGTGVSTVIGGQLFSYGNNTNNNNLGPEGTATGFLSAF